MTRNTHNTRAARARRSRPARRGLAMMLALVAVAVGTVIAAAALTMNDNAARIGQNAVSHTSSEWSAYAASELVVAAMQTETDWRDMIVNGMLLEKWTIADAEVDVQVTNLEGGAVSDADREVLLTIVADVNGIRTVVEKQVSLSSVSTFGEEIDVSLGEFGIFARDLIHLYDGCRVSVWSKSPEARLRPETKIGVDLDSLSYLVLGSSAELKNCEFYVKDSANGSLRNLIKDTRFSGGAVLPDIIPVSEVLLTDEDTALTAFAMNMDITSNQTYGYFFEFDQIYVHSKAQLIIDGASTPVVACGELRVEEGAEIVIRGDVRLITRADVHMQDGAITVEDGATLELFVGDDMVLDDSTIGLTTNIISINDRTANDIAGAPDPRRVRIYSVNHPDNSSQSWDWQIRDHSIVLGSIHAPTAKVGLSNYSTIVGRVTGSWVQMQWSSSLLYDPRLDNRMGFTDLKSPIYDGNSLRAEYEPTVYFLKTLGEQDREDMSTEEQMLMKLYYASDDQGAFIREITSILLDVDMRQTGDDVENPFTQIATRLYSGARNYNTVKKSISDLMNDIAPSNKVDVDDMLCSDEGFVAGLSTLVRTILGLDKGAKEKDEKVTVEDPKIDELGPDLDGNYTIRRAGKARAVSIEQLYASVENQ